MAKQNDFRAIRLHRLALLSPNLSQYYDFAFESRDKVILIKLWSAVKKDTTLMLASDGTARELTHVRVDIVSNDDSTKRLQGCARRVPKTRLLQKLPEGKNIRKVMLCYPPYKQMIWQQKGERRIIAYGDEVFDKIVLTAGQTEEILKNKE